MDDEPETWVELSAATRNVVRWLEMGAQSFPASEYCANGVGGTAGELVAPDAALDRGVNAAAPGAPASRGDELTGSVKCVSQC